MGTLLIVAPEAPPYYGAAVATTRLLAAGRRGCFRFHHVDTMDPAGTSNMGKLVPANFVLALKHYLSTARYLRNHRDIAAVYVLLSFTNAPAFWRDVGFVILARMSGKPVIAHCHDNMVEEFYRARSWVTRRVVRWVLEAARSVVVLCARMDAATRRAAPQARVAIVPNGLDLAPSAAEWHAPCHSPNAPVVLYLSRLSEEKGFFTALRVAEGVRRRGAAVRFEFAGAWESPAAEARAQRWVAERGLESVVRIWGPVTDRQKAGLLRGADAFLFPTNVRHEGQPLVILEAMAAGLPVISTDIGCIRDTILHGVTGFVLRPGDVDGMIDTLATLIEDGPGRRSMGAAARARYLADYTDDGFIRRMMALFRDAAPSVVSEAGDDRRAPGAYELR